jgi:hypothetical protein
VISISHPIADTGWMHNKYATIYCTFARLLNSKSLEHELSRPKTKLSLVRFFDNSRNSRATHDDWNGITEAFDRFGEYSQGSKNSRFQIESFFFNFSL